MNAQVQESTAIAIIPPKPPTVIERAMTVFSAVPSEDDLRELAQKSATITEITNEAGKQQCHAARMVLKNARLEITRTGEEGRDDAVKTSQAIIARQKALIKITQAEEDRLAVIQKAWDDRIAAEKEAAIQREISRTAAIQAGIDRIRNWPVLAAGKSTDIIQPMLTSAQGFEIDPAIFEERCEEAISALAVSVAALIGLLAVAKAHEAAQEQLKRDQEELAQRRAADAERERLAKIEQAEKERIVAEDRAKQEAETKAARDAEQKRISDELAAERAESRRIASERQAELDAQAATQAAETKRLADLQAEIDRKQAALTEAQKPKPEPVKVRTVERPSAAQIVAVISGHYGVSLEMAAKWIKSAKVELEAA